MAQSVHGQKLAVLKYEGGGDWYANPTALPNLARFCNESLSFDLDPKVDEVSFKSDEVFAYPFIHMTWHGNVFWSREEMERIRKYQVNRLKYYYAVAEFNSEMAANTVYTQCDGKEYELSATRFDLR